MPDSGLQITAETAASVGRPTVRGRFAKGRSGNPAGRPRGSVNRATRAAVMLLDGEAEALTRKAVELALAGDPVALRLCLERILGARRGRPVQLVGGVGLPPIATHADLIGAMNVITVAAMQGGITPDEAFALSKTVDSFNRTLEAGCLERVRLWRGRLRRMWAGKETRRICWGVD